MPNLGLSDHNCLCASIVTNFNCSSEEIKVNINKSSPLNSVNQADFLMKLESPGGREIISTWLESCNNNDALTANDLLASFVDMFSSLSTNVKSSSRKTKTKKSKGDNKSSWYSNRCKALKSSLNRAEKNYRRHPFNKHLQQMMINARKQYKRVCRESESKFRKMLAGRLLTVENNNPTEFWNLVNKMKNWGSPNQDPSECIHPNDWLAHFQSLFNVGPDTPQYLIDELEKHEKQPFFSELDFRITENEIEKALKKINTKAAPGVDKIAATLMCTGKKHLIPLYISLFNKIFSAAYYPIMWTQNFLKPIFKKGENWDPNNYRGIAIGSALAKLFSLILLERLEESIKKLQPISVNQIGFRKGHRTADHIFVLQTIINKIVKVEKKKVFVAFIDFEKAYDKVNRTLLLLKLQRLGIAGLFYKNIKAIYEQIFYIVKVNGGYLDPISSRLGLKQGGVLSPILFNVYIDDIKFVFDDTCDPLNIFENPLSHLLYADDLVLLSTSYTGLNNCLNRVAQFCHKWQLVINIKKSKVVVFNPSGRVISGLKFYIQGGNLEVVKTYCYLGIEMSTSGSFCVAKSNLIEKARKAMFPLYSIISQFNLPCKDALNLFHLLVKPISLYCSEVWAHLSHHQIRSLELKTTTLLKYMNTSDIGIMHQKFLKFILGVKRNCSNIATFGELGELTLLLHGFMSLLNCWHRTASLSDSLLVRQALNLQMVDGAQSEWISTVKFLLTQMGMGEHFNNPCMSGSDVFSKLCLTKLKNIFIEQWHTQLTGICNESGSTNKLRFYKLFKTSFISERYLDLIPNFQLRRSITKFRCSDHGLEIEIGRHKNISVENRICKMCKSKVETEEHFLRFCPKYDNLRLRYFGHLPTFLSWKQVLKCEDKITAFNLANFLTKALNLRQKSYVMEF